MCGVSRVRAGTLWALRMADTLSSIN